MTKRLLAIALVVLVAVSCVYLPSVVASAAEGDVFVANADEYNKSLVEVTFKIGQYRNDTVKVPAGAAADEAKLLTWAKDNLDKEVGLPAGETVSELVKVEGKENTYEVKTVKMVKVTFKGYKTGNADMVALTDEPIEVAAGTPVSEVLEKAPTAPLFPGKVFLNWIAYGENTLDNNGDGFVDNVSSATVNGNYGSYTNGTKVIYYGANVGDLITEKDIKGTNYTLDEDGYVVTGTNTYFNALASKPYTDKTAQVIAYGSSPYAYAPDVVYFQDRKNSNKDANVAVLHKLTYDEDTYVFDKWKQIEPAKDGTLQFVATYKVEAGKGQYTYQFDTNKNNNNYEVTINSDKLTVTPDDIVNDDVNNKVKEYVDANPSWRFKEWKVSVSGNTVTFTADYEEVKDYTVYYLDEAGFVTKKTAKFASDAEALLAPAPAVAPNYTFTKWIYAGDKVINAMYVEGADDSQLPPAKDGADSFKMAESLAPDYFGEGVAPTVGKTVTLKVTGAAATFDTAVEDVNEAIKVNFTGINCDVTSEGNVATVTLTGEGTAYVVATISYQGDVYTKTFTVTGIK